MTHETDALQETDYEVLSLIVKFRFQKLNFFLLHVFPYVLPL
jgi:hypothetical protein